MKVAILIVEDDTTNIKILEFYLKEYFGSKSGLSIHIDIANNGWEALGMLSVRKYDLLLLDVMMPKCDGFKVLNTFNLTNKTHRPYICMITGLGETKHKTLFKVKGANSYVIKPFDKAIFIDILDQFTTKYLKFEEEVSSVEQLEDTDEFFDFDDFYDDENIEQNELMTQFNESHKQLSAEEFLKSYENIEYILDDIREFDDDIYELIDILYADNLSTYLDDIIQLLSKYASFLDTFIDFAELSKSLKMLSEVLSTLESDILDDTQNEFISSFIKAILQDLQDWKEHVFILQDAVDVFYINASSLSSCMQLENYIKKFKGDI